MQLTYKYNSAEQPKKNEQKCNLLKIPSAKSISKRKPLSFLRAVTDSKALGQAYIDRAGKKQIASCNRNETIVEAINSRIDAKRHFEETGIGKRFSNYGLSSLNKKKLEAHCNGEKTLYCIGNYVGETLTCIDIDCHNGIGTLAGAIDAINLISKCPLFKNIYWEVSTNGVGIHGYFICDLGSIATGRDVYVSLLTDLALYLNSICAGCDIQNIEIKGQPGKLIFEKGRAVKNKNGQFIKIPRGLITRFEEVKNTSRFSLRELVAFIQENKLPGNNVEKDSIKFGNCAIENSGVKSCSNGGQYIDDSRFKELSRCGREYSDRFAVELNNLKVTASDWTTFLVILEHVTNDANPDGSQPILRFKAMWDALYAGGHTDRAWSNTRFTAMRNILVKLGHIETIDMNYTYFTDYRKGQGQACRWRASDVLINILESGSIYKTRHKLNANKDIEINDVEKESSLLIGRIQTSINVSKLIVKKNAQIGLTPTFKPKIDDLFLRMELFMAAA